MTTATATVIPIFAGQPKKGTWSPKARAKRKKTWARKRRERERLEKEKDRKGSKGANPIARPRAAYAARGAPKRAAAAPITLPTRAAAPGSPRAATEGRLDAIAYLRAATEGYEGVPSSVCLSLLALRRLLGQIK